MLTYYVIYNQLTDSYIRAGRSGRECRSLNLAKHFCNRWGAEQHLKRIAGNTLGYCIKSVLIG